MKLFEFSDIMSVSDDVKNIEIKDITKNSAEVGNGTVYFSVDEEETIAKEHITQAISNGASAAVGKFDIDLPNVFKSDNPRALYAKFAMRLFGDPQKKLKLIAITGTNGKTTVSYIVKGILEAMGEKCAVIGTIRNIIGDRSYDTELTTPDALNVAKLLSEAYASGCKYCVLEASSHALAQYRLDGCEFDVGVFTNLTEDHLDYHGCMESYLSAKKRLFELSDNAVLNLDDPAFEQIKESSKGEIITYSIKDRGADLCAKCAKSSPGGICFDILYGERLVRTSFITPGEFSVSNSLAALGAVILLGFDYEKAALCLKSIPAVKGRMEMIDIGNNRSVVIDYAHTPDGLQNVLKTVRRFAVGRVITVFGCGGNRDKQKRPIMGKIASGMSDIAVITSDNPRTEAPDEIIADIVKGVISKKNCVIIENREQAIRWAMDNSEPNDIIVLAGKGHETYQVVGDKRVHMDEREIIKKYMIAE